MAAVEIHAVADPASCRQVEALQRETWGMADRGIVPAEQIRAAVHNGGVLLLALDGDEPVGFCYAFVGLDGDRPILCSHMLAVRPGTRSRGIGRALKQAQRRLAAERGFAAITWTFDPLQARNAYLNLHVLGATARRYLVDHYGPMDDEINRGMPTDRLVAEWAVDGPPRAVVTSTADLPWLRPAAAPRVLPGVDAPDVLARDGCLVAVPTDLDRVRAQGADAQPADDVSTWRMALRTTLSAAFDAGLVATDLVRDAGDGVAAYVLTRAS